MAVDFDVVIVGSGFGGAVCAYRLAKAGARVLVLERGRRWNPGNFPRKPMDPWIWDDRHVERCHGWFDFRVFKKMSVVQGAGVGGGSLVYANIMVDAKADTFDQGWPPEITFERLQDLLDGEFQGQSPQTGVVDHAGEMFGHSGLFVADGAIVPKALGLNPSKTIAALAEIIAAGIGSRP